MGAPHPMGATVPVGAPGPLQLWRQQRARGACRGQPGPSRQARGTKPCCVPQCPSVCQAVPRACLSLASGTLLGCGTLGPGWATLWGPCPFPTKPKRHPWLAQSGAGGETPLGHLCQGVVMYPTSVGHSSWPHSTPPCLSFPLQRGCLGSSSRCGMGGDNRAG